MPWTTPRTWVAGEYPTAAIMNAHIRDNLAALAPVGADGWTAYGPQVTQGVTVATTINYAKYMRVGRLVTVVCSLAFTSAGTSGQAILVSLPVTLAAGAVGVGSFRYFQSGATNHAGAVLTRNTTQVEFYVSGNGNPMGVNPTFAVATGHHMQLVVTYEAAA